MRQKALGSKTIGELFTGMLLYLFQLRIEKFVRYAIYLYQCYDRLTSTKSRRGVSTEVYRCPLYGTPSAKGGCERWAFKSIDGYSDNHFRPVHCAIETPYMTDWPWQYGDLPWTTGQLPLAGEKLLDYIYRVIDPPWATIYANIVLAKANDLKDIVKEWPETDPDFASLCEEGKLPCGLPILRPMSSLLLPGPSVVTVESPEYIIID